MSEHIKHKFPSRNLTNVSFRSSSSVKEEEAACRSFFISIIKFLKDFSPMPLSLVPGNWRVKSPIELGPFLSSEHIVLVDLPEGGRKTVQLITWSPPTNMSFSKPKAHQLTSLIQRVVPYTTEESMFPCSDGCGRLGVQVNMELEQPHKQYRPQSSVHPPRGWEWALRSREFEVSG